MPRIRQKAEEYSEDDFRNEINAQRARAGLDTFESFGDAIGVSAKSAWSYTKEPGMIRMKHLRSMVKVIKPDPEIVLKALGYSGKDIRSMANVIVNR